MESSLPFRGSGSFSGIALERVAGIPLDAALSLWEVAPTWNHPLSPLPPYPRLFVCQQEGVPVKRNECDWFSEGRFALASKPTGGVKG